MQLHGLSFIKGFLFFILVFCVSRSEANKYPTVDTKQILCYDTTSAITPPTVGHIYYGQDAQYYGLHPSYHNNGDGTVSDLNTGLMWVQARGVEMAWTSATASASSCTVANYHDWRMPTIKELYSLIQYDGANGPGLYSTTGYIPFIDTTYFGFAYGDTALGVRVIDCQDWSGTKYVALTFLTNTTVFGVNFADGRIKGYPQYNPGTTTPYQLYVRYVRGNSSFGTNNFVDNGDNTISDTNSGLIWTKSDSGSGMNWQSALAYVTAKNVANYLGHDDWRLPNAKELQSIVDYTRAPDITNSPAINPIFSYSSITNEGGELDYPFYWTNTSLVDGTPNEVPASYLAFGRALGWQESPPGSGIWVVMDVHGAGAERCDPKSGSESDYPHGRGPQGDVVRITNYVRLVRGNSFFYIPTAIPRRYWELFR